MPAFQGRRGFLGWLVNGLMALFSLAPWPVGVANARRIFGEFRKEGAMELPEPRTEGKVALERAIRNRRTVRDFSATALTMKQFSQLLWAAQGITEDGGGKRAAPSAGALYPMDLYAAVGTEGVDGLHAGIYHYDTAAHAVTKISTGDRRRAVAKASLSQMWVAKPAVSLVITAEYSRIAIKYGNRGVRYAMIEAGHIGQNLFLQAEALGLAAGIVGAFDDRDVIRTMGIPDSHEPLLIMPVGHKV